MNTDRVEKFLENLKKVLAFSQQMWYNVFNETTNDKQMKGRNTMKKTIIVSKKTEEQFVSATEHTVDSKVMITLTREDGTTKEVSQSTFKRWYKTVEVEIKEVEIKNSKKQSKKLNKKLNKVLKAEDIKNGEFLGFYATPKMKIQQIGVDAANQLFGEMDLDRVHGLLSAAEFNRPRRAYVNVETGNVGVRFQNQLFEIVGLNAYL